MLFLARMAWKVLAPSMSTINLSSYGIEGPVVLRNLPPSRLYIEAIRHEPTSTISDTGALIAYSGAKTGRSPKDKRIVSNPDSKDDIWWGKVNIAIDENTFLTNRERAVDYLNVCERLYVVDAFAG